MVVVGWVAIHGCVHTETRAVWIAIFFGRFGFGERRTDIALIQKLLGHSSIKTTMIYTHASKKTLHRVKNPLDNLKIDL